MEDPKEVLKYVIFSDLIPNVSPFDPNPRYFHMFSSTKNYLVLPLSSAAFEPKQMLDSCRRGKSVLDGFRFDEEGKTVFRIFDKNNFRWVEQVYQAPASLQLHMIQANEDGANIVFDTLLAGTGSYLDRYYFEVSRNNWFKSMDMGY